MASRFYAPAEGPVEIGLTAVTVPNLPGLYWHRDGEERPSTGLLMLPGVTVRAGDFEPGARVTVTVEAAEEGKDG
jgi:hypothetical protein